MQQRCDTLSGNRAYVVYSWTSRPAGTQFAIFNGLLHFLPLRGIKNACKRTRTRDVIVHHVGGVGSAVVYGAGRANNDTSGSNSWNRVKTLCIAMSQRKYVLLDED